ncbi:MAG: hypothetical protein LKI24_05460 [Acidipropionibacterium sp.]|nr:hypothetical protein [Acidipropionibacterium sp.]
MTTLPLSATISGSVCSVLIWTALIGQSGTRTSITRGDCAEMLIGPPPP